VNRKIIGFVVVFCATVGATAQRQGVLSSVRQISQLDAGSASHSLPVDFQATLTYFRPYEQTMFVEDGDAAIFVKATTDAPLAPGDRIRVRGITVSGLRPYVESHDITLAGRGSLPVPRSANFADLISSADDCVRVIVHGRVRSVVEETKTDVRGGNRPRQDAIRMEILTDGGLIEALIDQSRERSFDRYLDADVEITGIAGGKFDGKLEQTGVVVHVATMDDVRIVRPASRDPWSIPATPLNQVMRTYNVRDMTQRVRVTGTITFYEPGSAAVIQDGTRSLWISTLQRDRFALGEVVDVTGFPDTHPGFLTLVNAQIRGLNSRAQLAPATVTWDDLAASRKVFDLVTIEGRVLTENRETGQDEYVVSSGGHLFTAIFRHNVLYRFADEPMPAMRQVEPGSIVRITGICVPQDSNPFAGEVPFNVFLRSVDDIQVIALPSWLSVRHLLFVLAALLLMLFLFGIRMWLVEHRIRRQNAASAYIEQRRARILEDINNGRPLSETLERVTELVSAHLYGAACWCTIVDGPRLGNAPTAGFSGMRIVEMPIPARSGGALGTLYAAFPARTTPASIESETLARAAGLAALAIETTRLYADLVHRSEFDLLTDAQNRFSLEKFIDEEIEHARNVAGAFGVLYIDLDGFKQVNDEFGHHVGDLYLKLVAERMKRQLRPGDMLARLGGDEFAAVIPSAHSRAKLEEIATRLERCFAEPFVCGEFVLRGSASVGMALYPADGATRDSLLKAADSAMYDRKRSRVAHLEHSSSYPAPVE
jgi:diguanylate cyclase (GGDEF)-like protein